MFIPLSDVKKAATHLKRKLAARIRGKKRYEDNKDSMKAAALAWARKNPDKVKVSQQKYHAANQAAITKRHQRNRVRKVNEGKCVDCSSPLTHYAVLCDMCTLRHRLKARVNRPCAKWEQGMPGPGPIMTDEEIRQRIS